MLKGKNAIVTGAQGGIGSAIVENFAKNGANIWACAHKKDIDFESRLDDISKKYSVTIESIYFDLTDSVQMKDAVKHIVSQKQSIDILVNNAGVAQYDAFSRMSMDTLKNTMNVNYYAPLQFTQFLSRRMNKEGGSIIFVSSIAGLEGISGNTAYGASKAALAHSTKVLSTEMAPMGVRVNAVAPGMVDTAMRLKADEVTWDTLVERTSLKRCAKPEEIANVICFLASDLASYITGQVIRVDGGMN